MALVGLAHNFPKAGAQHAAYAGITPERRARLGLDKPSEEIRSKRPRRGPAEYSGEAIAPGGCKFSVEGQQSICSFMEMLFDGKYWRESNIDLSAGDERVFEADWSLRDADTYGEILPQGTFDMLWTVGAKPGDRFYDLGSGTGKVVALAWMAGLRATGVELSKARWQASCKAVKNMSTSDNHDDDHIVQSPTLGIDFLCASLYDVDFTDADVVFACSLLFSAELISKLAATARWMKPGSRIVSYQVFDGPEFKEIGRFTTPTTWSRSTSWVVQEVVSNPSDESLRPDQIWRPDQFPPSCLSSFQEVQQS